MSINRRGFLKRLAAAFGIALVGKKISPAEERHKQWFLPVEPSEERYFFDPKDAPVAQEDDSESYFFKPDSKWRDTPYYEPED